MDFTWFYYPCQKKGELEKIINNGICILLETNSTQLKIDGWKMLEDEPFLLGKAHFQGQDALPQNPEGKGL